ncbi:hypothetical protein MyChFU_30090 [Mycobacterium intracellulare subsp. chimaera]
MTERARQVPSGFEIRDTLTTYLVKTLQGLEKDAYFFLPKIPVIPDWAGWEEQAEAQEHGDGLRFYFPYQTFLKVGIDADSLCGRLTELWESWGWTCSTSRLGDHYDLVGTSPDAFELVAHGISGQRGFTLLVASPVFEEPTPGDAVAMPFAVTRDGPRSLSEMQELHPELFN